MAVSTVHKTVVWGSDKLDASKQDPANLMCHVVSYFNNRLWQNAKYFNYCHVLLFISVHDTDKALR